jgi:predicted transcriptional regulator
MVPNQMLRLRLADSQTTDFPVSAFGACPLHNGPTATRGIIQLMSPSFLDQLATQLRNNKTAACRRAIQRILDVVKKEYKRGKYGSHTEAENEFRRLVEHEEACR